jgi:hypothetical protein
MDGGAMVVAVGSLCELSQIIRRKTFKAIPLN